MPLSGSPSAAGRNGSLGAERAGDDLSHRDDGRLGPGLSSISGSRIIGTVPARSRPRTSTARTRSCHGTTTDGACKRNCSFVSGEASTGFWMVAPASLLPPPWRGPAIVAAFAFGVRREPAEARLRRPLSQRRAARRAHHAHRHRGRPARDLAARRLRAGVLRRPGVRGSRRRDGASARGVSL